MRPVRQSQTCRTKRLKNNVFSQNSQKTGFWLLSGLSEFYVYCSLCIFAMIFTIYVSCRWMSRLTFEKKNGIKKWYLQAIWCPDLKSYEKIVTIFCSFLVFLLFFWCILKSVRSNITPKLNIFHAIHVVSGQEQSDLQGTSFLYPKISEEYPDISLFLLAETAS